MNRPKRIVILIDDLQPGGSERVVADLCAGLPRERYTVSVIALLSGGPMAEEIRRTGARVFVLGLRRLNLPVALWSLVVRLRRERYDVAHCFRLAGRTIGSLAARAAGVPKIIIGWGSPPTGKWRRFEALACRWATRLEACSDAVAREISRCHGVPKARIATLHHGIRVKGNCLGRTAARRALGLPDTGAVIGIVANHRKEKDYPCLLRASAQVLRAFPEALFVSIGGGRGLAETRALAARLGVEKSWRFLGARSDAAALYSAFDVFALPSRTEGFGIVLLEAMHAGVPCVASDAGGIPEVVVHEGTGLLFPAGDAEALADGICRLLNDPQQRKVLRDAGRRRFRAEFTVEQMVAATGRLYDS